MEYVIIFTDKNTNLHSLQVVRYQIGGEHPLTFESEYEADRWADKYLDGLPYQVINVEDFKKSS